MAARKQRIRRLLAVLEDVGRYSASYASPRMLAGAWERVGELLLASDDPVLTANVTEVVMLEIGSAHWWLAVRKLTRAIDDRQAGDSWQAQRHAGNLRERPGGTKCPELQPPMSTFGTEHRARWHQTLC